MMEVRWATRTHGNTQVTEMDGAMGSIHLGDPKVDRLSSQLASHLVSSCIILIQNEIHNQSFPSHTITRSVRDFVVPRNCVDPHSRAVSYFFHPLPKPFEAELLCFMNSFGMPQLVGRSFDVGLSAFYLHSFTTRPHTKWHQPLSKCCMACATIITLPCGLVSATQLVSGSRKQENT